MTNKFKELSRRDFLISSGSILTAAQFINVEPVSAQTRENCVFCKMVDGKQANHKIWEDKNFYAFLDHKPVNPGHTLLIPKKHLEYVFEMDEKSYSNIFKRAMFLAKPLREAMGSQRVGVLIEGFGVAHLHIHLIPINKGDGFGKRGGKEGVSEEEFRIVAEKIRQRIVSL